MDIRTKIRRILFENDDSNIISNKYWGTIAAGVIPFATDTKKFLLSLRSQEVKEPGTWGVVGGKLDDGETDPKIAAVREVNEEIGVNINYDLLKLIYVYKSPKKDENNKPIFSYYTYLASITDEIPELENRNFGWEVDECKWFSLEEIKKLPNLHFGVKELIKNNILSKVIK